MKPFIWPIVAALVAVGPAPSALAQPQDLALATIVSERSDGVLSVENGRMLVTVWIDDARRVGLSLRAGMLALARIERNDER